MKEEDAVTQDTGGRKAWVISPGSMEEVMAQIEFCQESNGRRAFEQGSQCKGLSQNNTA